MLGIIIIIRITTISNSITISVNQTKFIMTVRKTIIGYRYNQPNNLNNQLTNQS